VEGLVSSAGTATSWQGRRVLVTGHTGFKGSWLTLWLHQLGAEVAGLSLAPATDPACSRRRGSAIWSITTSPISATWRRSSA